MTYALDTGTIIALLNCDETVTTRMDRAVLTGEKFTIPPVVDYEIQRGLLYKPSPKKEQMYFTLRKLFGVGVMMPEMWLRAARIYVDLRRSGTHSEMMIFSLPLFVLKTGIHSLLEILKTLLTFQNYALKIGHHSRKYRKQAE